MNNLPVRKISSSHTSLRGKTNSNKNNRTHAFESSLERDFLNILEFDIYVKEYCEQPLSIEYLENGAIRTYTPDFIVYYRDDIELTSDFKPMLCEIKPRTNLKKNWRELKPKFKAAVKYAKERGWTFKIITEKEIRNEYLDNVKFLSYFRNQHDKIDQSDFSFLLMKLKELRITSPEELLALACRDDTKRAELIYTLWYMISNYFIRCDLNVKLTMRSEIWKAN
jgi:hypothetical protein